MGCVQGIVDIIALFHAVMRGIPGGNLIGGAGCVNFIMT
jgi:hypothetical protein